MEELRQSFMFPGLRPQHTAQQCLELLIALPPLKRAIVERCWECAFTHYRTTHRQMKTSDLEALLKRRYADEPRSLVSYSRAHRDLKKAGYEDLLPWPIKFQQRPPWEGAVLPDEEPVERKDDDDDVQPPPQEQIDAGQLTFDAGAFHLNGKPVLLEVLRGGAVRVRPVVHVLAAVVSVVVMLDGLDGKIDNHIHWCMIVLNLLRDGVTK